MNSHPKILRALFGLTSNDERIPTDLELDSEIEKLSFYMSNVYPLIVSIIKRKILLFIRYKWQIALRKLIVTGMLVSASYIGYRIYIRPTYQSLVIKEKITAIERDMNTNPIPQENMDFMIAIQKLESTSNYLCKKGQYLGAYQMGDLARKEVGLSCMPDSIFLQSRVVQNWAMNEYMKMNYKYLTGVIVKYNIPLYGGVRVGNHIVTISGLIASAHLVGASAVKQFISSNGIIVPKDGNGTELTKYLELNNIKLNLK